MSDHDAAYYHAECDATIRDLRAELQRYKDALKIAMEGIQNHLDGNYSHPRCNRPLPCKHGTQYYNECIQCDSDHLQALLAAIVLSLTAKETIHTWDSMVESHRFESLLGSLGLGDALKEIYGEIRELTSTIENV